MNKIIQLVDVMFLTLYLPTFVRLTSPPTLLMNDPGRLLTCKAKTANKDGR